MSIQVWKQFDANNITHSMAHYLMAIHDLLTRQGYARVTDVARELEITPGSASVSIRTLKDKGFVAEDHNRFLNLTVEGQRVAHSVRVANRSFVHFLVDVLGVDLDQAEIDSCKVEHLVSTETRQKLLNYLHFALSDDPVASAFREKLHEHGFACPGKPSCELCENHECELQCLPEHEHDHEHGHHDDPKAANAPA
ncbi:MAG: metal-dependent transcriptional regulator [Sumerlaeia bacterium]